MAREPGEEEAMDFRGVLKRESTEPRIFVEVGVADRSRLLLRDRPSVRLRLRRNASWA